MTPTPQGGAPTATIRPRRPDDVAALVDVLAEQQPTSLYPIRWPLPVPAEQFVVRPGELAAWCAEVDGTPVGHVCVQGLAGAASTVSSDALARLWADGHGRPVDELGVVSALFAATSTWGTGLGGRLLDTAVAHIRAAGLAPCLDVTQGPGPAVDVYRHRGWEVVGDVRPPWLPEAAPPMLVMVLRS